MKYLQRTVAENWVQLSKLTEPELRSIQSQWHGAKLKIGARVPVNSDKSEGTTQEQARSMNREQSKVTLQVRQTFGALEVDELQLP